MEFTVSEAPAEAVCSPSTSVDAPASTKEDEEPELFIDIESVDNRPEGRDRRRAYIDFYRKVKSARQREPGPLLNCALCDCQVLSNDNAIHTHDRRDILKLCAVIQECFPRACPRVKKEGVREFDLIIKTIDEKRLMEVKCGQCDAVVKATKAAMTRHAHQHPMYRCKVCKFTSEYVRSPRK
ncbi:hypothetical protein COOONC_02819 [Cooperia oncophora]